MSTDRTNARSAGPAQDLVAAEVHVRADARRAFEVFTAGIDRWWLRGHHVLAGTLAEIGVEPRVGGRVWERNDAGEECTFGRVLDWRPGELFAFSWLLGADWQPPAADAVGSRVTVTFTPVPDGTVVRLVHDGLAAHGEGWEDLRDAVGSRGGWDTLLGCFAAAC